MKQEAHIARYAEALTAAGIEPDFDLLHRVTMACGPLIYAPATEVLTLADLPAFRKSLIRKFGPLPAFDEAIQAAWETCAEPRYRAVLFYILTRHFGKAASLG
ncbi:DUF2853 family protein [Rhodobacter sp. KR11]|jgi:hypothetical protein|uniref:DUF2853 family protein n=1 Tax=Rhodobacter sp. KR11 TaxID=2974588 RepID=UPI002223BA89|nr:DUF2853 family protein [Rhodobacter sp. KR11]MCW1918962.1 DUF2853 family protein [Rhodobacter sp. KR11]